MRSEKAPINGSENASNINAMRSALPVYKGFKPTMVR